MARQMKAGHKFVLILLVMSGIGAAGWFGWPYLEKLAPPSRGASGGSSAPVAIPNNSKYDLVRVAVVTWGGYAGGQYFNRGFKPNPDSRYIQEYGLPVEFVVMDDYLASREAWKAGEVHLLWATADSFPTEASSMASFEPTIVFQSDWSRGGDVIVSREGIGSMRDLRGKRVSVAFGTPSHTFLLRMLESAGMSVRDIQIVEVPSAIDSAAAFKAGQVEAAVVWSPDDEDCVQSVRGSKRLVSTKEAAYIIADVFYGKKGWVESHQEELKALVEGWLRGAAEVNTNPSAKAQAVRILAEGLNQPESFTEIAINNARLTTYGDNVNFFNLSGNATGVTGERLYMETGALYQANTNLVSGRLPNWRQVTDTSALRAVNLNGPEHAAEGQFQFAKATQAQASAEAFSSKAVSVSFPTGSATLDPNARTIIDLGFVPTAKAFASVRIRIEGNTDVTGSYDTNKRLSEARARAVADYLAQEYGFDRNRFIVVGNGPDKPVCRDDSADCYARNRRTDFELLQ
ncbi:MAG TPA: phosphate ABC transporter substrate-binding/OmpA family protein [Candidatus Paceibacterota bacterium]|nr:phosphate ABC transporter substrate-binding/OmpA family protein [Candidatus Paceibacterota bacterium]